MSKLIKLDSEAKKELVTGINLLSDCVKATLGPGGKYAAYLDQYNKPVVTKDGIAVADQVFNLDEPLQELGVSIVRQAAKKTATTAGDGTTTSIVLAQAFINKGLSVLDSLGPRQITATLKQLETDVIQELDSLKKECSDLETIRNVATISANGDVQVAELIVNAIDEVGNEGVITIDDNTDNTTILDLSDGYQITNGFLSQYFTNDVNKTKAILDDCLIAVIDKNIENALELMKVLGISVESGKPLLLIAPNISTEVLEALIVNHVKAAIKVCAVKCPKMGGTTHEILQDICATTGAQLISDTFERKLPEVKLEWLGSAKKVVVTRDYTTIMEGNGNQSDIESRVANIKEALKSAESPYQIEKFKERIAKLVGKIAVIRVGAATDVERIEKKARVEDAIQATKAAIQEGIVPGGGAALTYIYSRLKSDYNGFKEVLLAPFNQILQNANIKAEIDNTLWYCYNAVTNECKDALETGVIDPVIVTKQAITNAISVTTMILNTNVIFAEKNSRLPGITDQ